MRKDITNKEIEKCLKKDMTLKEIAKELNTNVMTIHQAISGKRKCPVTGKRMKERKICSVPGCQGIVPDYVVNGHILTKLCKWCFITHGEPRSVNLKPNKQWDTKVNIWTGKGIANSIYYDYVCSYRKRIND